MPRPDTGARGARTLGAVASLPTLTADQLNDDQRVVWDLVTGGRRSETMNMVDAAGGLSGPFNAMLHAPLVGRHLSEAGDALRFQSSLSDRIVELVTVTVAAHWKSEFEWAIHAAIATSCGVPDQILAAIAHGRPFDPASRAEAVALDVARQLLTTGRLTPETGAEALELHGPRGFVEVVNLVGYYCTIAFMLSAFDVALPAGATPVWAEPA